MHFLRTPLVHFARLVLQPFELLHLMVVFRHALGKAQLAFLCIIAVGTGIKVRMTFKKLNDAVAALVEKIAVMRNGDHSAFVFVQKIAEPFDGVKVEMVGRLIEQENIRIL